MASDASSSEARDKDAPRLVDLLAGVDDLVHVLYNSIWAGAHSLDRVEDALVRAGAQLWVKIRESLGSNPWAQSEITRHA